MRTDETVSKTKNRLTTVAAVTGSAVIIALSAAFVAVDFNDFYISPSFTVDSSSVEALEPLRSDPVSEQNDSSGDSGNTGNGTDGNGNDSSNGNGLTGGDGDNSGRPLDSDYPDHDLPCLDPNCPVHHGNNSSGHISPCNDPDCPICNHDSPCGDPNCPICNGHGLPCNDPNCPIHHGDNSEDDRPPVDISMETIRFKANSYEYVDKESAERILSEYIDSIDRYFDIYPDGKIYLVGCIAKTGSWSLTETELSQQRADTVRQSLIDLGVDDDKIVALGIGISDPWRSDEWINGYFDENIARNNRRVWLIPDRYNEQVELVLAVDEMIDELREAD